LYVGKAPATNNNLIKVKFNHTSNAFSKPLEVYKQTAPLLAKNVFASASKVYVFANGHWGDIKY